MFKILKRKLLNIYSKEELLDKLIAMDSFTTGKHMASSIWGDVFRKNPDLIDWIRERKNILLKSTLVSNNSDILKGQLLEWSYVEKFDVVDYSRGKVEESKEIKIVDKNTFLNNWNLNKNARQDKKTS